MAVALFILKARGLIETAFVLDIDLHWGDGTETIMWEAPWVTVFNVEARTREEYLPEVEREMAACRADLIGISAGFDMHAQDWGGVLLTRDYEEIGRLAKAAAVRERAGLFAILEGGFNQASLGESVAALCRGMDGGG